MFPRKADICVGNDIKKIYGRLKATFIAGSIMTPSPRRDLGRGDGTRRSTYNITWKLPLFYPFSTSRPGDGPVRYY